MMPISVGETVVEWRGVGFEEDPADVRATRVRHHNQIWGPMGRNLPEDVIAVEDQWKQMGSRRVPYSIIAREHELLDDGRIQNLDDGNVRHFYQMWSRLMDRRPNEPFGNQ
jgi:methanesulfonate monooxygenase large subunit